MTSFSALDVRLITALQVLQVLGRLRAFPRYAIEVARRLPLVSKCRPASGRPPVRNLVDPLYEFEPTFFGQAAGALVVLVMG